MSSILDALDRTERGSRKGGTRPHLGRAVQPVVAPKASSRGLPMFIGLTLILILSTTASIFLVRHFFLSRPLGASTQRTDPTEGMRISVRAENGDSSRSHPAHVRPEESNLPGEPLQESEYPRTAEPGKPFPEPEVGSSPSQSQGNVGRGEWETSQRTAEDNVPFSPPLSGPPFRLTGTIRAGQRLRAIIDGKFYSDGDWVNGHQILEVGDRYVRVTGWPERIWVSSQ